MARIRFKLSTLLVLFTISAIAIGLGYQVYTLRQDVTRLTNEVTALKQQSTVIRSTFIQPAPTPTQIKRIPFRLLNTDVIVDPSLEEGMKAGEWEHQRRIEEFRDLDKMRIPADRRNSRDKLLNPDTR